MFQRQSPTAEFALRSDRFADLSDCLVRSVSFTYFSEIRVMRLGQHLGTNVIRRAKARGGFSVTVDLKRLAALAYDRLENSKDLVRKFQRFRKAYHPDFEPLKKLYDWLFVPFTLADRHRRSISRGAASRDCRQTAGQGNDSFDRPASTGTE